MNVNETVPFWWIGIRVFAPFSSIYMQVKIGDLCLGMRIRAFGPIASGNVGRMKNTKCWCGMGLSSSCEDGTQWECILLVLLKK
jgi:hypothetical protein